MPQTSYMTAAEASKELGVSRQTLYAYVSRGVIRSEPHNEKKRTRRYNAEDVRVMKLRAEKKRNPDKTIDEALHWGAPLLESAITLIADGRFTYRGHDAVALSETRSIGDVARLIWLGELDAEYEDDIPPPRLPPEFDLLRRRAEPLRTVELFQTLLPVLASDDLAAYDFRPPSVARTGAAILRAMTAIAADGHWNPRGVVATLKDAWGATVPNAESLLNRALILCVDHELNVSSFTARCVASSGATPYAAVVAALSAMTGVKHGGNTARVEAFLREIGSDGDAREVIGGRIRRGEDVPGFGHPLYPDGDPRGAALMDALSDLFPDAGNVQLARRVEADVFALTQQRPTIDYALVNVMRALRQPPSEALALFALGRTVGWVGHVIEQYGENRLIRPRARYVGKPPRG
ncbi:MAG: citrate synthase family protein [Candidatus Poribacteria bacterium]|nr:citrate synthase family protein [Candidatus Poribacteria bacterium]